MKKKDKLADPIQADRKRNDALNKSTREDHKLPGDYPANEDIMNRTDTTRIGLDVENFSRSDGFESSHTMTDPIITDPIANSHTDSDDVVEPILDTINDPEQSLANDMEWPLPKDLSIAEEDLQLATGNESDVTQEDLQALGPKDLSLDMGEDEQLLKNRVWPVDMAGQDLDIPLADDEKNAKDQMLADEDEENDFYSLGGDAHEDSLEGK